MNYYRVLKDGKKIYGNAICFKSKEIKEDKCRVFPEEKYICSNGEFIFVPAGTKTEVFIGRCDIDGIRVFEGDVVTLYSKYSDKEIITGVVEEDIDAWVLLLSDDKPCHVIDAEGNKVDIHDNCVIKIINDGCSDEIGDR